MSRRLATAVLALLVALTGIGVCARGMQACAAMMASAADCCGDAVNLTESGCCCPARGARAAAFLPAGDLGRAAGFDPLLATAADLVVTPPTAAPEKSFARVFVARALAPPGTPVALRTLLLI